MAPFWHGDTQWKDQGQTMTYEATSSAIVTECKKAPDRYLVLPLIVQGVHQLFLDDRVVLQTGDPTFSRGSSLYNRGSISCKEIQDGKILKWKVYASTKILAGIYRFPSIEKGYVTSFLYNQTFATVAAGSLPVLGFIFAIMFWGKAPHTSILSLLFMSIFTGIYFMLSVPSSYGINLPSYHLHRMGDASLWVGCICIEIFYYSKKLLNSVVKHIHFSFVVLSIVIILLSKSLDQAQVGSMMAIAFNFVMVITILVEALLATLKSRLTLSGVFQLISIVIFVGTAINDFMSAMGIVPITIFHIGAFASISLLAFSVNDDIRTVYKEREFLQKNLEKQVEIKTSDVQAKSLELEKALASLKNAEADLIQSAKLASLGTLAAGIAHEINNSLNYVNGSIKPLQKMLSKDVLGEEEKKKSITLLGLMKEGLDLTFAIISNLKEYARSNSNELEPVSLGKAVDSVLLLLKSKLSRGISVTTDIPDNLYITARKVSVSQILMNLVSNAIDALLTSDVTTKEIRISAAKVGDHEIEVRVRDSGPGIPLKIRDRIFDPFFTTKKVGQGTGLGLHIVRNEVNSNNAKISFMSEEGKYTEFRLVFQGALGAECEKKAA